MELPILRRPGGAAEEIQAEPVVGDGTSAPRSNILVVDDEASIVDVLYQAEKLDGHRVDTAGNGKVALRKIRDGSYDVIISDLKMPGMSGEDLYDNVREIHPDLARRMIFSTGDVASQETQEFLRRCGNRYLQKPFDLVAIRSLITTVLSNRPN